MTIINCGENCHYQHEGYCKLNHSAAISMVRVNGCSYFKEKRPAKSTKFTSQINKKDK